MELIREKVIELMNTHGTGTYNGFARLLGLPVSNLHTYMTTGYGGGRKIISAVMRFCIEKGLNPEDYIDFK